MLFSSPDTVIIRSSDEEVAGSSAGQPDVSSNRTPRLSRLPVGSEAGLIFQAASFERGSSPPSFRHSSDFTRIVHNESDWATTGEYLNSTQRRCSETGTRRRLSSLSGGERALNTPSVSLMSLAPYLATLPPVGFRRRGECQLLAPLVGLQGSSNTLNHTRDSSTSKQRS